jgi:hypothetical protein
MDERGYVAQALFQRLTERGIVFSVLGDAEKIPEAISSDLDMAVSRLDLEEMPETISVFCHDFGLRLVQLIRHERSACYFVLAWLDEVGGLQFLAPDFCSDYRRAGRLILPAEEFISSVGQMLDAQGAPRGFPVPPADVQFVYYLVKKVDKMELADEHGDYLSRQWNADPDGALRRMVRFWPELADRGLIARAAADNEWAEVQSQLPRLRRALHRAVRRTPFDLLAEAGRPGPGRPTAERGWLSRPCVRGCASESPPRATPRSRTFSRPSRRTPTRPDSSSPASTRAPTTRASTT